MGTNRYVCEHGHVLEVNCRCMNSHLTIKHVVHNDVAKYPRYVECYAAGRIENSTLLPITKDEVVNHIINSMDSRSYVDDDGYEWEVSLFGEDIHVEITHPRLALVQKFRLTVEKDD